MLKKISCILLSTLLASTLCITPVSASDNFPCSSITEGTEQTTDESSNVGAMYINDGISTYSMITEVHGDGGNAFLDYMKSGYIQWGVEPATIYPYTFKGNLIIKETNGVTVDVIPLYLSLKLGRQDDQYNLAPSGLVRGHKYLAYLEGTATDITDTQFTVIEGFHIAFTYGSD